LDPKSSSKVAAFDLDGTLIKGDVKSNSTPVWEWWRNVVPSKLKEVHQSGCGLSLSSLLACIYILSPISPWELSSIGTLS
jgi:bifunctional polynucleotide phosphatase/kinase